MLQVWSVDEEEVNYFEHAMLQNMMKMLKNLSMNYLKQMGGGTEVDLLDYQELPLPTILFRFVNSRLLFFISLLIFSGKLIFDKLQSKESKGLAFFFADQIWLLTYW